MFEKYGLKPISINSCKVGDRFGRLKVLAVGWKGRYRYYAICQCDCGIEKSIRIDGLSSGKVISCGCYRLEVVKKHGLTESVHYDRWKKMLDRCENPASPSFPNYGGRGIKVCERWHDIANFISDLPDGFEPGMEIDRIDNNGDYCPGNIRWSTKQSNSCNRRSTRLITHNGVTRTAKEWSLLLGGAHGLVAERIDEFGWSEERAVTTPVADRHEKILHAQQKRWVGHVKKPKRETHPKAPRTVELNGKQVTALDISKITGKPVTLIRKQLFERGWPVEKVLNKK